jgi:hypothetical protein
VRGDCKASAHNGEMVLPQQRSVNRPIICIGLKSRYMYIPFSGVAIWQLYTVVTYFTSWPTSTTFEYVYARERNFPAVTLCNLNPVRQSRTTKLTAGSAARSFFDTQKGKVRMVDHGKKYNLL